MSLIKKMINDLHYTYDSGKTSDKWWEARFLTHYIYRLCPSIKRLRKNKTKLQLFNILKQIDYNHMVIISDHQFIDKTASGGKGGCQIGLYGNDNFGIIIHDKYLIAMELFKSNKLFKESLRAHNIPDQPITGRIISYD